MRVSSTEGWKWISSCDSIIHFNFRTGLQVKKSCFSLPLQLFVMPTVSLNKVKLKLGWSTPWCQRLGRTNSPQLRRKQLVTYHFISTIIGSWGQMWFTQGCWGNWFGCLPSCFLPPVSAPGQLERPQRTGVFPTWILSIRSVIMRIQGTKDPLALSWCQERLWGRLSWVKSHGMCRTTRRSGPVNMSSWKTAPFWPTWSPSMIKHSIWWIKERLLM